ncbi:uncharacterized protein Dwil_GK10987 [Drosophila willistoni]|uniref:Uncharacterized protein n=2 Tax=Drosophila willistoni TaxID=7260 RepID=B4N8Q6_DROWI|nr:uncharacterized protein LOC6648043 isoform X2 [Drosophila willistoni]EDW81507.2 uncharacterized protein Dwil_GK10987 [Drosophila willistoni]
MHDDVISVSGNVTVNSIWKIDPSDRIELHINTYHWEIGVWQPTVYNLIYKDFCLAMWDNTTYLYNFWSQHIINVDEIKEKCFKVAGTIIYYEDWVNQMVLDVIGPTLYGRFQIELILMAFDNFGKQRPRNVCFQTTCEFRKKKS